MTNIVDLMNMDLTNLQREKVASLIERIGSEYEYEIVPVKVEDYSKPLSCFPNVEKKVCLDGGSIYYGWKVHFGNYIAEAERHAVWMNDDDELICITPTEKKRNLLFLSQIIDQLITKNKLITYV